MTDSLECPVCGAKAKQFARLHCNKNCPWLVCGTKDCGTTYDVEDPEAHFM